MLRQSFSVDHLKSNIFRSFSQNQSPKILPSAIYYRDLFSAFVLRQKLCCPHPPHHTGRNRSFPDLKLIFVKGFHSFQKRTCCAEKAAAARQISWQLLAPHPLLCTNVPSSLCFQMPLCQNKGSPAPHCLYAGKRAFWFLCVFVFMRAAFCVCLPGSPVPAPVQNK